MGRKKIYILAVLGFLLVLAGCDLKAGGAEQDGKGLKTINIGIQQSIGPLLLAKEKGWFEKEFKKEGIEVKWTEFQSGPPHFEAIASDRLDCGQVGNSPVIAAQSAGIPFKEIANTSNGLKGNAILVQKESGIKDLKDLKGRKIAVAKGSSGFNLLYRALSKAGLKPDDVKIIQLQPDEAQPAFETGAVDAWSIWEPFISLETIGKGARILTDGQLLNVYSPGFTVVRTKFAEQHPEQVIRFLKVYEKARLWEEKHQSEAVSLYAKVKKVDQKIIKQVIKNNKALNIPISDGIVKAQQKTADFQYSLDAIKKKINTNEVVDNSYIKKALKEVKKEGGDKN
ncbi:aliphatic sulfonate ABC transporter substrate-binding protein [Fictibacillus gelatini]|uniref:aliphatic sulfonate ABC transporter substrate-binding protein n=1 Tax=Fictibacillus gelatini TaxID=225985 RepID=UPI000412FC93|nr:aliphatic sulfonate ABC transporter substrate-binding protein [Fictibacillus gelatini]